MSDAAALLGVGIYSVPQASTLARVKPGRLRRWLRGYEFTKDGERHTSGRVIHGQIPAMGGTLALSFLDLQEARCLNEFRDRHISWVTIRETHEKARRALRTDHPFSTGKFKTVGRSILLDYATEVGDDELLDLVKSQTAFRAVLDRYLRGLEFLGDAPARWFPLANSRQVVIDPQRGFGRPIVTKYGVATEVLGKAYRAERSFKKVAAWYDVDVESVRDAVRYERKLAA